MVDRLIPPSVREVSARINVAPSVELFYRAWLPSQPLRTLVLIHGAGQHSGWFGPLGAYCVPHDIAVYALDLRGFGQSGGSRGHVLRFEEYLDDLGQFIDLVVNRHPGHPIFLLGHSLGATIAIRYGQNRPASIDGIILSAPALRLRNPVSRPLYFVLVLLSRLTPWIGLNVARWQPLLSKMARFSSLVDFEPRSTVDPWTTTRFSVRWLIELLRNGQKALDQASTMRLSVLSLCSNTDPLIDPDAVHQFYEALTVRNKQYIMLPSASHDWILQDNARDPVYAYLVHWIITHT